GAEATPEGLPMPGILFGMAHGLHASRKGVQDVAGGEPRPIDQTAILGAVREDVRQTLRSGWVDAALEAAAGQPVFFTAAWSAIRPNVGRSFLLLAKALRAQAPEEAWPVLEDAGEALGLPALPATMRLLARWPAALTGLWDELGPVVRSSAWTAGAQRVRRTMLAGIGSLPHPVELQWMALRERGFSEDSRARLADALAAHDAA